jgi:flagellar biosynthesis/type III secretory pathway M-ring protein FliF/YscJ
LKRLAEAKQYITKAIQLSVKIGSKGDLKGGYEGLSMIELAEKNYQQAYEHYKLFIVYRDSLSNEENTKKNIQAQMQYDFDKKESESKAEQEKKDLKSEEDKHKQKIILWFTVSGLLVVLLLAAIIFRSLLLNRRKNKLISEQKQLVEKQKEIVEEKQKEILDSIHYARRIQRSLLTSELYITRNLERLNRKN